VQEEHLLAELESSKQPEGSAQDAPREVAIGDMLSIEEVQAAIDAPGVSKTRKQKLKQRLKQLQVLAGDVDFVWSLIIVFEAPVSQRRRSIQDLCVLYIAVQPQR
jgi:hypothetical protein